MGTRSKVGVMVGDKCRAVYVHWDGYLDNNGAILAEHYMDPFKVRELMDLGDVSSLGPNIGTQHDFDIPFQYGTPEYQAEADRRRGITTFYGRDRGETGTEFKTDSTFEAFFDRVESCCGEWYYIMKDGVWYCGDTYGKYGDGSSISRKLVSYAEALEIQAAQREAEDA